MMKYGIVTPAKNEAEYIKLTLDSVVGQTMEPECWMIVNDNSIDQTENIITEYNKRFPWIHIINYPLPISERQGGTKVVNIVNFGLANMDLSGLDFIVKLDADLTLPPNYFEEIGKEFFADNKSGILGGYCVVEKDGRLIREEVAPYHVRGAFKSYRRECFEMIGGIPQVYNWDGLDELKALSCGWKVKVLQLAVIHHRPTGKETNKGMKSAFKSGKEYYRDGNDFIIALLRSIKVAKRVYPQLASGIIFLVGYIYSFIRRDRKNVDKDLEAFIRRFQYERIHGMIKRFLGWDT